MRYELPCILIVIICVSIYICVVGRTGIFEQMTPSPEKTTSLGNLVAMYFINMAKAFQEGKDYVYEHKNENDVMKNMPKKMSVSEYPNVQQELSKIAPIKSDIELWVCTTDDIANMWRIIKPIAHEILDGVFKKMGKTPESNIPIIHFRCSDIPFIRSKHYKLSKHSFYSDCINELVSSGGVNCEKIQIMYSNVHKSDNKNATSCDSYVEHIKPHIQKNNANVVKEIVVTSSTEVQDFVNLFYAPAVISIGSSFSFISGYLGKGVFLSSGHIDGEENKCTVCKWLKRGYSVPHESIPDYYNTDETVKILDK